MDLEALRNGKPPLQAHKRFDVSMLKQLEKGEIVEVKEKIYQEDTIANYRMAVLVLSAVAAAFFLVERRRIIASDDVIQAERENCGCIE